MTPDLCYLHPALDRVSERRTDAAWIASRLADPATRMVPVRGSRVLVAGPPAAPHLAYASATDDWWQGAAEPPQLLGLVDGVAHFVADLQHIGDPRSDPRITSRGRLMDLREMGWLLPRGDGALAAQARALWWFHRQARFCGACGRPTLPVEAGTSRRCSDEKCGVQVFPRLDPAVIVLVTHGERALLGRQKVWPKGMHSVLAGFVEPGESLESCIRREVREEAGVTLADIRYQASQPWPFPQSLMLAYRADAATTDIARNDAELEDADWYERAFLQSIRHRRPGEGDFFLPAGHSVARWLIDCWLDEAG